MIRKTTDKNFDCVQFMREARDRVSAELEPMTSDERVDWMNSRRFDHPALERLAELGWSRQETDYKE